MRQHCRLSTLVRLNARTLIKRSRKQCRTYHLRLCGTPLLQCCPLKSLDIVGEKLHDEEELNAQNRLCPFPSVMPSNKLAASQSRAIAGRVDSCAAFPFELSFTSVWNISCYIRLPSSKTRPQAFYTFSISTDSPSSHFPTASYILSKPPFPKVASFLSISCPATAICAVPRY